jgi:uncharacterized alpha/beta hydrolase family protein
MKKIIIGVVIGLAGLYVLGNAILAVNLLRHENEFVYGAKSGKGPLLPPTSSLHIKYQRVEVRTEDDAGSAKATASRRKRAFTKTQWHVTTI